MRVLDLGCGPGIVSQALAKEVGDGEVVGVDRSELMLARGRALIDTNAVPNVTLQSMDAASLTFEDRSFDFVWSLRVFQHLPDPLHVLGHVYRILKPGGIVCLIDPDKGAYWLVPQSRTFDAYFERANEAQHAQGGDPYMGRKLGAYLADAGFADVDVRVDVQVGRGEQIRAFANNVIPTVGRLYLPNETLRTEHTRAELLRAAELKGAHLYTNWFVATGRRPAVEPQTRSDSPRVHVAK